MGLNMKEKQAVTKEYKTRYSASTCKELTNNIRDSGKTSFGRIFYSAKNRALRGSALPRSGPGCAVPLKQLPQALAKSLARLRCPPLAATSCPNHPKG
jgi:hypothetical protein